ncbi:MAG: hypothetical protein F6K26_14755 [Moorea sp. SIO2I5]|nr:hypothetical protein [Moorena sp. SIO2I5]
MGIVRIVVPRSAVPDSRFPIPDSRFPIPDSRFPTPFSKKDLINLPNSR